MQCCGVSIPIDDIIAEINKQLKDDYVNDIKIDKEKNRLVLTRRYGAELFVTREALESWLQIQGGGIKSGTLIIDGDTQTIKVVNKDDTIVNIDVSALKDDHLVQDGTRLENNVLILKLKSGVEIRVDFATLVPANSPYIVSGVFIEDNGKYWLDFTRNDNTHVKVDMTDIIKKITDAVYERVMNAGYRINNQAGDYTLVDADFDGRTIVRMNKAGDCTLTVAKPPDSFIGKAVIVRKTEGAAGTFVNLVTASGVTISPDDTTPLRRTGSTVTLVYVGGGAWDVFGELP